MIKIRLQIEVYGTYYRQTLSNTPACTPWYIGLLLGHSDKGNEDYLYSAISVCHTHKALRHGSHSLTCRLDHACLSFVSVHQMTLLLTGVADTQLQISTHLWTTNG